MQIDEELTLKKLEIFLAFMRTGNLSRAAVELQTSTVSVHRAIHSLESALRCPLFKHEGRNLTPLESAYVLEERAQKLVQEVLATVELTRQAAGFSWKNCSRRSMAAWESRETAFTLSIAIPPILINRRKN